MKCRWVTSFLVLCLVSCGGGPEDEADTSNVVSGPGDVSGINGAEATAAARGDRSAAMANAEEGGKGEAVEAVTCAPFEADVTQVTGVLYEDIESPSLSLYASEVDDSDEPISQWPVTLLPEGIPTETCDDGRFSFSGLDEGIYVVDMGVAKEPCTTRNCPVRFPNAVRSGKVRITTFGDSVPKQGSNVLFPARLKDLLSDIVEVENRNVAIPGSRAVDWVPGMYNFDQELAPILPDTDVLIASIGGNDVTQYASEVLASGQVMDVLNGGVNDKLMEILGNVLGIFEEARKINPDMDLVYCLYPNYANSEQWDEFLNGAGGLGIDIKAIVSGLIVDALDQVRVEMPVEPGMILVDMYGAMGDADITDILFDQLHFNDAGHQRYADEILKALGGVVVGAEPTDDLTVGMMP